MALSQKDIDKFLDENVQDNVKILTDVVAGLKKDRKRLSAQVNIMIHFIYNDSICFILAFRKSGK